MNKDDFIDLLIQRVMEKLEGSFEDNNNTPEKIESLNQEPKRNIACIYFSPEQVKLAEEMGDEANFIFRDRIYRNMDVDEVWIGRFSYDDLTKMALGLNTSFGYIMEVIMKGIPVYIFPEGREYLRYEDKAPIFLVNMWRSYEKKIYNLGIYFDNPLEKGRNHFHEQDNSFTVGEKYVYGEEGLQGNMGEKHFVEKKLLTESDIQTLPKNTSVIEIPKRTIITPLAKDYLRQRKISCIRKV